jgi:hypothetical protein
MELEQNNTRSIMQLQQTEEERDAQLVQLNTMKEEFLSLNEKAQSRIVQLERDVNILKFVNHSLKMHLFNIIIIFRLMSLSKITREPFRSCTILQKNVTLFLIK